MEIIDFQRCSFLKGCKDYFNFLKFSTYLARARARASTVAPPPPRPVGGGGAPLSPLKKFLKVLRFFRGLTFRARAFSKCVSFCSDSRCEMLHLLRFRNLPNRVLFWSRLTTWVTNSAHFFGHGKKAGFEINFQECL